MLKKAKAKEKLPPPAIRNDQQIQTQLEVEFVLVFDPPDCPEDAKVGGQSGRVKDR